jgi:hypothetical protein
MTTPQNPVQDQFAALTSHSQEAVTTALNTWADTVQSFAGRAGQPPLPDLSSAVDQYFGFAEKVLAGQRQLAQQWASVIAEAAAAVTEQARRGTEPVAAHTADVAEASVEHTADTGRVAANTAAPAATAPSIVDHSDS